MEEHLRVFLEKYCTLLEVLKMIEKSFCDAHYPLSAMIYSKDKNKSVRDLIRQVLKLCGEEHILEPNFDDEEYILEPNFNDEDHRL